MIPFYRLLEVSLYSLLNFLPFLILALYPFRKQLRFSIPITSGFIVLISLIQIAIGLLASFSPLDSGVLSLLSTGLYVTFYFAVVKSRFDKLLFTILVLSNVSNLVVVSAKFLEGIFFGSLALEPYRWSLCVCLILMHLVVTLPLYFYINRQYAKVIHIQSSSWSYLWVIPAIFYLVWYYHLYLTGKSSLQVALDVQSTLFLLFFNLGAFFVYHTVVQLLLEQEKAQMLTQQNHLLTMHQMQYDNLQNRINEARQAKHDVRHHTHLIREYLRSGKLQELEAYLNNYEESLPDFQSLIYCQHYATNTLLGYYAQQAQSSGIDIDIFVQLPETIKLPETTLSVVLGNLLENAVEACRQITEGEKKITVRGKVNMGAVFFEITNTFHGTLRRSKSGKILSTKSNSRGMGLESVSQIVQAYGGMLEVNVKNETFCASVLLQEQPDQK